MSGPTTQAGRDLLARLFELGQRWPSTRGVGSASDIAAIEAEARATVAPPSDPCMACRHDECLPTGCGYVYSAGEPCNCDPAQRARLNAPPSDPAAPLREARWATWIDEMGRLFPSAIADWACFECKPESDCLVDDFQCVYHEARVALTPAPKEAEA